MELGLLVMGWGCHGVGAVGDGVEAVGDGIGAVGDGAAR